MKFLLHLHRILHRSVRVGDADAQLVHPLLTFLGRIYEASHACLECIGSSIGINTGICHHTHVERCIIHRITCSREDRSRHAHRRAEAVNIQRGIVAGIRKNVGIFCRIVKRSAESVDRGHKSAGNRVKISAFTCCQIHGRSQSCSRLLCC